MPLKDLMEHDPVYETAEAGAEEDAWKPGSSPTQSASTIPRPRASETTRPRRPISELF
jgi:hypothetical protein